MISAYSWKRNMVKLGRSGKSFTHKPWAQGVILIALVVVAMLLANLPATKDIYHSILETEIGLRITSPSGASFDFPKEMTVEKFINDILMVVFFFTVGLEIKREIVSGELSSVKKAIMPVIAAVGGVLVPACIYTAINHSTAAASGWGIPTATDIAFAVGIMALLGDRIPVSLKIFLTALAIADDLMAILVVAIFYGESVNLILLGIAFVILFLLYLANRAGEKRSWVYFIPAIAVWVLFYYSGVHATMSGVAMAFLVPIKPRFSKQYYLHKREKHIRLLAKYANHKNFPNGHQRKVLTEISKTAKDCIGVSYRLEHALNPWVNFLIMPIFALANAGVTIPSMEYFNIFNYSPELGSVSMGIVFGLLIGKPVGITLASLIAVKSKLGAMPQNASWAMLFAVACLGGIGFTMSIFVDTLSFGDFPEHTEQLRNMGKVAVLMGSFLSAVLGCILVRLASRNNNNKNIEAQ